MRTKADAIAELRADQRFWRDLAAQAGPARWSEPGPMGEWTFGDMAGHLLGWRERTIARVEAIGRGDPEPPDPWPAALEDDDAANDWIHAQHAGSSPAQLVDAYDRSFDRLIAAIEAVPDALASDPSAAPWFGSAVVDGDYTGHLHDEHVEPVREWLARRPDAASEDA